VDPSCPALSKWLSFGKGKSLMMATAIELEHVTRAYPGGVRRWNGVSLRVWDGPSGCADGAVGFGQNHDCSTWWMAWTWRRPGAGRGARS